jgi:hypothetical protein
VSRSLHTFAREGAADAHQLRPFLLFSCPPVTSRRLQGRLTAAALAGWALASAGLGTSPAAASPAHSVAGRAPGTIFVANSTAALPSGQPVGVPVGHGSITVYRPGAKGNARPEAVVTAGVNGPSALTFDAAGNLWVANLTSSTVVEYSTAELANVSPAPTVTISEGAQSNLTGPYGVAFDTAGNLWIANGNALVEYARGELAKSGAPKPEVTLTGFGGPAGGDCGIAFDPAGDLWQGNSSTSAIVLTELSKAQLTKSGFVTPEVDIRSLNGGGACNPAFDRSGDMWVGNFDTNTVVEYTQAQLGEWASSGPPGPAPKASAGINSPGDVAFDRSGNLWVPSAGKNAVIELSRSDITNSGSPAPTVTIAGPATRLDSPWAIAIEP